MNATITRPNTTPSITFTGGSSLALGSPSLVALQALVDQLTNLPVARGFSVPAGGTRHHPLPRVADAPSLRVYAAPSASVFPEAPTQKPLVAWDKATAAVAYQSRLAAERKAAELKRNQCIGEAALARLDVTLSEARLGRAKARVEVVKGFDSPSLEAGYIQHLRLVSEENICYAFIAERCYRLGDLETRTQELKGMLERVQKSCARLRAMEESLVGVAEAAVAEVEAELASRIERLRLAEGALEGLEAKSEVRTA